MQALRQIIHISHIRRLSLAGNIRSVLCSLSSLEKRDYFELTSFPNAANIFIKNNITPTRLSEHLKKNKDHIALNYINDFQTHQE